MTSTNTLIWRRDTVPYSFRGTNVLGYAEDELGAWVVEYDPNMVGKYCLYRFENDVSSYGFMLIDLFDTQAEAEDYAVWN